MLHLLIVGSNSKSRLCNMPFPVLIACAESAWTGA